MPKREEEIYLPTKALNIISNISDFCNEEFFLKISGDTTHFHRYKNNLLQLLTVNGPKIGEGYGTSLFLKSDEMKELGCRVGFIGESAVLEKQLKALIPGCKIMELNQNLNNDTIIEILNENISEGNLTKFESEEIENYETLANLIEDSFREKVLDGLFIKFWFSLTDFLKFFQEIEVSENSICQINARIKLSINTLEAVSKQFLDLFDSHFYSLHIDVRGNELQIFFINFKRLDCIEKFFSPYCNKMGSVF
uniref:Uncharacterized protein n=1 Tax=Panagrolaimus sp. PS1159 TaxID=55785 RepID=A0AC35EWC6_9BILA